MDKAKVQKPWLNVNRVWSGAGDGGLTVGEAAANDPALLDWKQATSDGRRQMKERYKFIMKELDLACGGFIAGKAEFQFMDVCCCPGGFSEYILLAAPGARGVGLSLDTALGGHIPSFETVDPQTGCGMPCPLLNKARYHLHYVDITTVATQIVCNKMEPHTQPNAPERCLQIADSAAVHPTRNQCQLMVLDGSFLGGKKNIYMETRYKNDLENPTFNCYSSHVAAHQALLAAQLAIMAWNAADGATVVMRMSMTWSHFTNSVLALLRRLFTGEVQNYKPRSCHQTAISYYLVCKGFNLAAANKLQVGQGFAGLLQRLRSGAPAANLVPFPSLPEGESDAQLYCMWGLALQVYHLPLWLFRKLCEDAEKQPYVLNFEYKCKPCWRHLVFRDTLSGCRTDGSCRLGAHGDVDLHPCISVAFRQLNGQLFMPNPDGTLLPGQGHARNEEQAVLHRGCSGADREGVTRQRALEVCQLQHNPPPPPACVAHIKLRLGTQGWWWRRVVLQVTHLQRTLTSDCLPVSAGARDGGIQLKNNVCEEVLTWGEEQLRLGQMRVQLGVDLSQHPCFTLIRDTMFTPIAQQVWARMLNISADEEIRLFQNITATGVVRLGPGGFTLLGRAHQQAEMMGHSSFAAERVLRGPVPGASPCGSAMPVSRAFTGALTRLPNGQIKKQNGLPVFGASALGKRSAAAAPPSQPPPAKRVADMGDVYLDGGGMAGDAQDDVMHSPGGGDGGGLGGVQGSGGRTSGSLLGPGEGVAQEEHGPGSSYPVNTRLSGYHTPFVAVTVAKDDYSHDAMLNYLS